jgi:5'-3' exonuclease
MKPINGGNEHTTSKMPHTVLIDGSFLTHRAFHAPIAAEMTNRAGVSVTAVYSYTRSMIKMLADPHFAAESIGRAFISLILIIFLKQNKCS